LRALRPPVSERKTAKLNQRSIPVAAAAEPAAPRPVRARSGLVDLQAAALEVLAVHDRHGLLGLILVRHLDETEAPRLAAELVLDDRGGLDCPERLEGLLEVGLRRVERQIAHVDVHTRLLLTMDRPGPCPERPQKNIDSNKGEEYATDEGLCPFPYSIRKKGKKTRQCPTLPPGPPGSTIGTQGLSFRVRNGNGRFPFVMIAGI
jgi:hypothetical protein